MEDWTMVRQNEKSRSLQRIGRVLCILGIVIVVFSLVMGVLILFIIPGGRIFFSRLQLILLGGFCLIGILSLLIGKVVMRKIRDMQAQSEAVLNRGLAS